MYEGMRARGGELLSTDLTAVNPAIRVLLAWTVALTVRSAVLSFVSWSSQGVSE
jgi:hypothetical protein